MNKKKKKTRVIKLRQQETFSFYLFISPWIIGFLIFGFGPLIFSFALSFQEWNMLTPAKFVGLKNYAHLKDDPLFWLSMYNTVFYTIFAVTLGQVWALILATLLNQKVKLRALFRTIYYLPSVISGVSLSVLWIWMFHPNFGIVNYFLGMLGVPRISWLASEVWAKPALIIMSLWTVGIPMLIYLAGLQNIPNQLYEAAEIDGANRWRKFWRITLPLITPSIFFNVVISTIGSFQVFTQAFIMTGGGPVFSTLFYVLYLYRTAFNYFKLGYAATLAWVLFGILLVLTFIQFRLSRRWVYYATEE